MGHVELAFFLRCLSTTLITKVGSALPAVTAVTRRHLPSRKKHMPLPAVTCRDLP